MTSVRQRSPLPTLTTTPPPLDAVSEDGTISPIWKLPPSLQPRHSSYKGKSRDASDGRPVSMISHEWTVNAVTTREGADEWKSRDRIVLILGQPTPESLSPLLYDDIYQDTLLLIGTPTPDPNIQALLKGSDAKPIRPIVRTFSPNTDGNVTAALLKEAQNIAQSYRNRRAKSNRRMSSLSLGRADSPSPSFKRMSLYSGSASTLPRSGSDVSIPGRRQTKSDSRPPLAVLSTPVLFDAVINFLHSPSLGQQRAMQEMLHQTMVITTGIWPILMANPDSMSDLPTLLLHVMPSGVTGAVPHVIEDYLISFSSNIAHGARRDLRALAVHSSIWRTPVVELASGPIAQNFSGANVLMFNGLSPLRASALVSRWKSCADVSMPPLEDARPRLQRPSSAASRFSSKGPALYTITQPTSPSGYSSQQREVGLETPELDHAAMSSSSSTSGSAENTETTTENAVQPVKVVGDGDDTTTTQSNGSVGKKKGVWKRLFGRTRTP
ncbi:hypothetical protein BD324DRAFT_649350 [Kockovaella imperatae]|uniref:Uncharacterized protein n=1 Tax=Kockovaella imperatae TaxID=4999 RepID=A0A1Y1UMI2_9TREE|nr:hypothetical protein BD324DRAFT_649350 [Kockovaella imperatae]ORX39268.1 hypothetical protein BD324DRAFT_649350 [Kockovaella imperatae]